MAYEVKHNSGSLWAQEKQSETHPDLKGTINVNGTLYTLTAWEKTSSSGKKYFSCKLKQLISTNEVPVP